MEVSVSKIEEKSTQFRVGLAMDLRNKVKNHMNPREKIFDQRNFDDQPLTCPKCGWKGTGLDALIIDFYGVSKFKQVSCPDCQEYLGNLSNDRSFTPGGNESNR